MNKDNLISLKVTLLGETTVGKTSIIYQFIKKTFITSNLTTIGCDKFSRIITIQKRNILLNLWDTAGQERFKSLSPMFLKGSNIVILVYDITNEDSFTQLENFWINIVRDNTQNIVLGIAANKIDLYDKEIVDEERGRKFAESVNGIFACLSAKNYLSIEEFFFQLANSYFDENGFDTDLKEYSFLTNDLISQQNQTFEYKNSDKSKVCC